MKIMGIKGTRDFYPEQMAVRNRIVDGWKNVSVRNGFVEYDGPIFEYLKMYQVKSGDEIVEQLFNFEDRGGRHLAIRPEITPTLARMVNQKINSLGRPIKWFSVPRLCRAERPQKGRLREFFQWNIDIIGVDDVAADAEVIFCSVDYLRAAGLTSEDVKAKISSRRLLAEYLKSIGIGEKDLDGLYPVLDKKPKIPADAFKKMLDERVGDDGKVDAIIEFMGLSDIGGVEKLIGAKGEKSGELHKSIDDLKSLFNYLRVMGVGDYCVFDPGIVRGLAYYTGVVFEIHDVVGDLRAICGGGRYDNLLKDFGGPAISGTGMGMGDCVLEILLEQKGLLGGDEDGSGLDYFVAFTDRKYFEKMLEVTGKLRENGKAVNFSYKGGNLGKQLKQAAGQGAKNCIIIGEEIEKNELAVKDMVKGEQKLIGEVEFFEGVLKTN